MANQSSPEDPTTTLGVLSAVERDSEITQRSISGELGIALGLANAYVRRCARKGWIKVHQAPMNRYAYYLTPKGFAEKSRLTAEYLAVSLNFFRNARQECAGLLADCVHEGWTRLALAGVGELAEIAILSATETRAEVVCLIDLRGKTSTYHGRPAFDSVRGAIDWAAARGGIDAIIVTDVSAPQASYDAVVAAALQLGKSRDRVLAPALLRVSMGQSNKGEAIA